MLNKTTQGYDLHIIYNTLRIIGNTVIEGFEGLVTMVANKLSFTQPPKAWNSGAQAGDTKTGVYGTSGSGGYYLTPANSALAASDLDDSSSYSWQKIKNFWIDESTGNCKVVYNNKDFPLTTGYNLTSRMMTIETLSSDTETTQQNLFYGSDCHFRFLILTGSVTNIKYVGKRPDDPKRIIILNKTNHTVNLVRSPHTDYSTFYSNDTIAVNQAKSFIDDRYGWLLKIV